MTLDIRSVRSVVVPTAGYANGSAQPPIGQSEASAGIKGTEKSLSVEIE
ncbi:hypothetical protein [Chamaesiphon sp. GL140_3_metabinner_50]|nr:hypothetical protein [Chamaesiphon sp. GL140_3_metabinner_50]